MFSRLHTISGRSHTISSKLHYSNSNSCRLNSLSNNLHNSIKSNAPSKRLYSVRAKKTPTFRDLFHTPVFKTLFLTLVFGSVVVECTKNRKEIEGLQTAYGAKNRVLREVTHKIKAKEPVDVASELSVANSMTRNKYHSVTDVQLDQSFEDFLKMADDDLDMAFEVEEQGYVSEPQLASSSERKNTSKFL